MVDLDEDIVIEIEYDIVDRSRSVVAPGTNLLPFPIWKAAVHME